MPKPETKNERKKRKAFFKWVLSTFIRITENLLLCLSALWTTFVKPFPMVG
jgi:hypothetical protein